MWLPAADPQAWKFPVCLRILRIHSFPKDYPELKGTGAEIYLVDGGAHLLAPMSAASQKDTFDALEKMGVKIKLQTQVKDFTDDKVILSTGEIIETRNLIWTAGVTAMVFEGIPPACYGKGKRLFADPYNKVIGLEDIYAIGDTCLQTHEAAYPNGHPQLAQVSIQQAKLLGANFKSMSEVKELKPFHYKDIGTLGNHRKKQSGVLIFRTMSILKDLLPGLSGYLSTCFP